MRGLLIVAVILALSACAVVEPAIFRNPQTGEVHECNSGASGGAFPLVNAWTAQHEIDTCAAAYSRMGWARQ
jgi:hypothetical protein